MDRSALPLDVERAVRSRYGAAAREREAALCCPVDYDPRHLEAIPTQVLERDYGCGDPSRCVRPGDTVLDLGSGGGKICFIASQIVGEAGRVIGVDVNDEMLALAYAEHLIPLAPRAEVPEERRTPFDCARTAPRHPRETKGDGYRATTAADDCCGPGGC